MKSPALGVATALGIGLFAAWLLYRVDMGLDAALETERAQLAALRAGWADLVERRAVLVTAYAPVAGQTDDTPHLTALGYPAVRGVIAVDPKVIPLRSWLYVPGYGWGLAADTGGKIKGSRIDVLVEDPGEARTWGRRLEVVLIVRPEAIRRGMGEGGGDGNVGSN
jgi:3D (Asp-Asp-Asp) domain-containing protein